MSDKYQMIISCVENIVTYFNEPILEKYNFDAGQVGNEPALFNTKDHVLWNPLKDETYRFNVDPIEYYGLNAVLDFIKDYISKSNISDKKKDRLIGLLISFKLE